MDIPVYKILLFISFTNFVFSQDLQVNDILNKPLTELTQRFESRKYEVKYDTVYPPFRIKFTHQDIYYTIFFSGMFKGIKTCKRVIVTPQENYDCCGTILHHLNTRYSYVGNELWERGDIEIRIYYPRGGHIVDGMFFEWTLK